MSRHGANSRVSGTGKSNANLAYAALDSSRLDYGDYSDIAFQNGVFFSIWADNSNSTGDNPSETDPICGCTKQKFDIYTRKVIVP